MESLCSHSLSLFSLFATPHSLICDTHTDSLSLPTVILSLPYQDNFNPTRPFVISPLLSDFLLVLSAPSVLPTFSPSAFLFGSSSTRTRRTWKGRVSRQRRRRWRLSVAGQEELFRRASARFVIFSFSRARAFFYYHPTLLRM